MSLLIDLGFDIDAMTSRGALHWAAGGGDLDLVKLLVDHRGDLSARDATYNETPLGWARFFDQAEVAAYLESITKG